ncbi:MAG: flavodoxin family protein [Erysipelotrichaceae bacterium]|nr:flavodoxin family protein [Erysipelotrichaceae bacterium]
MKPIIVYASTHHGNTRKIVDAIAKEYGVETVDATGVKEKDLSKYDLIGFASGIYAGKFHPSIRQFAKNNLPVNKKIFFLSTSAMNRDFSASMKEALNGKDPDVLGKYSCFGYNTFGPFKLIGGTSKGHPDEEDIRNALAFYKKISETCSRFQDVI